MRPHLSSCTFGVSHNPERVQARLVLSTELPEDAFWLRKRGHANLQVQTLVAKQHGPSRKLACTQKK
jgi:hypothetical protein